MFEHCFCIAVCTGSINISDSDTKNVLRCYFKIVIHEPSVCYIEGSLPFSKTVLILTLFFPRYAVADACLKEGSLSKILHSIRSCVANTCSVTFSYRF